MSLTRRSALVLGLGAPFLPTRAARAALDWNTVLNRARGQTVYWNAWAGDGQTNAFIAWAGGETQRRYGVAIEHVRLRDTAEAVAKVVAERQAGRVEGGGVDLIWINGPNFLAMKQQGLLHGPFAADLPNWRYVDTEHRPSNLVDFTVPVEGYAVPWRIAQVVYVYDSARTGIDRLPRSSADMVAYARANQGRLTHPNVRNFLGATFLKQALVELSPDRARLQQPADDAAFAAQTAPLWQWYAALRPNLWRRGQEFPDTGPAQRQLLADDEIDLYIAFNPAEAAVGIAASQLPATARVLVFPGGTIGNTSFVAIPANAAHKEAAMVVADFLLEPETQARAQDPRSMGNFTVLDLAKVAPEQRRQFARPDGYPSLPTNEELGTPLPEPHPSWMTRIAAEWERLVAR